MPNYWRGKRGHLTNAGHESAFDSMFGSNPTTNPQPPPQKSWLTGYLLPLGSVLIAVLTFLTQKVPVPKWAIILAGLYLVLVTGATLHGHVVWLFSLMLRKYRLKRIEKAISPRLLKSIEQIQHLIEQGQMNTLPYVLHEASQMETLRDQSSLLSPEPVEIIRTWLTSIQRRADEYERSDFSNLSWELSHLIHEYNRFCWQRLQTLQQAIASGKLPEQSLRHLKQRWNVQRENHAAFIREWTDLAKEINAMTSQKLCIEYYEALGTLE